MTKPQNHSVAMMLFDLDGTLVDSRRDITTATNLMLEELKLPLLTVETVGQFIGDGARMLIVRALSASLERDADDGEVTQGLEIFKVAYQEHLLDSTTVYPNVSAVLERLAGIPKAVVTNKPYGFSMQILEGLGLARFFSVVLGGDTLPQRKPRPEPVLAALARHHISPSQAVMVGDSANDMLAGRAAGTLTCGVTYGLRNRAELETAGADVIVDDFSELIEHFLVTNDR